MSSMYIYFSRIAALRGNILLSSAVNSFITLSTKNELLIILYVIIHVYDI